MNKSNKKFSAIALAAGLVFSAGVMAQSMTKNDYKNNKATISADYTSAKTACASFSGNAKDICVLEAKGKEKIAKAELEASYKPTVKTHYNARVAKAEADYAVSKERCDDLAGNPKDVCIKEAKAALTTATANAKLQMKTTDANEKANETTTDANNKANTKVAEARTDATTEKRDAQYKVAAEKCDAFAASAKDNCLAQAKTKYSKP
ncbi:MAG: hypothetical protein V4713_05410 [Pseudomonadota bacterium]